MATRVNTRGSLSRSAGPPAVERLETRAMCSSSLELTGTPVFKSDQRVYSVIAADLNGDGAGDLIVAAGNTVRVRMRHPDGTFAPARTVGRFALNTGMLAAGDFDGDGKVDIAAARVDGTVMANGLPGAAQTWVRVLWGDGSGGFSAGPKAMLGERVRTFGAAHFVAGAAEQLLLNGWVLDVRGRSAGIAAVRAVPEGVSTASAADLDGDGLAEIVGVGVVSPTDYRRRIVVERNLGGLVFAQAFARTVSDFGAIGPSSSILLADVVGDAEPEVVCTGSVNGALATGYFPVVRSGADLSLGDPVVVSRRLGGTSGEDSGIVGVADMNADGRADIVVWDRVAFQSYLGLDEGRTDSTTSVVTLASRGDGTFAQASMPWLDTYGSSAGLSGMPTPDISTPYALDIGAASGSPRGPEVFAFAPSGNQWRFVRVRNTEAWKNPVVPTAYPTMFVSTYAPGFRGGPGIAVGDRLTLESFSVFTPEAMRFVSVQSPRFFLDANGNGVLDDGDLALGAASAQYGYDWQLRSVPVDQRWLASAVGGRVRVFVQVTDSRGASSVRSMQGAFRPV